MSHEKVLFVYTSLIKEGMSPNEIYAPDPILTGIDSNQLYIIAVTAPFIGSPDTTYWHEIDILLDGKTMINSEHDGKSSFNILKSSHFGDNKYYYLACFNIHGVMLPKDGIYTASVAIYDNDEQGNKRSLLDTKESNFVITGAI